MAVDYTYVVSKSDDGTIQITFTFPYSQIEIYRSKIVEEESKNITVPGFRRGTAPLDQVINQIPKDTLVNRTLSSILSDTLSETIKKENINIAIYPKFELISSNDNEPWQVRAITCELPSIEIVDYKKAIEDESIKTQNPEPEDKDNKGKKEEINNKKELSQGEKETLVLKKMLEISKIKLPKLLIDEDVNQRLSNLLGRIEKLGLNLEGYLSSIGKTPESLRTEYEKQSEESLILEIALNKIADEEKVEITEKQIEEAIKTTSADPVLAEELKKPEKRNVFVSVLRRQETLKKLTELVK